MCDFNELIESYLNRTSRGKNSAPVNLTDDELVELVIAAKAAGDAHPATWAKFNMLLTDSTDLKANAAKATFRECRITADLRGYPYSVSDFIPMFLKSRRYAMKFSGTLTNQAPCGIIYN